MRVKNIRIIKDLITEAEEIERRLSFIIEENDEYEAKALFTRLRGLLETEATTYNIEELWFFVQNNSEPIGSEYQRILKGKVESEESYI